MDNRNLLRVIAVIVLTLACVGSVSAQYGSRGDKRYRDRYSRADTYGDVVEIRLNNPGTLEEKMPKGMENRVRLLRIEGPMDNKDFKYVKKLCDRSRCVDNREKSVDNYLDLELEHARIMSAGTQGLLGGSGQRDVLDNALAYASHLRSIVLPERLKRIGNNALTGCSNLEEVIMPPSVRSLGSSAFSSCRRLEYVMLSEGLQEIGDECFSNCENLRHVNIPRSVTEIGDRAFRGTGLQHVELPHGLLSLGKGVFENTPLTELEIPASTQVTDNNLGYMSKMQEIYVEPGSRYYTCEDGSLYDNTGRVLLLYPAGRTGGFTIPEGVEAIGPLAFYGALIGAVQVPPSVVEVGASAFEKCYHLQHIDLPGVTTMGKCAFKYCSGLTSFTVGRDIKVIPQEAFEECKNLQEVRLPSSVTTIAMRAFKNCPKIASVEFSIGLTEVGKEAFEGNKALTAIDLPSALKTIGERAFKNCRGLTHVSLPDACTTLDKEAFRECTAMTEIDLGSGLKTLGDNALRETAITTLVLPEGITHVGKKVAEKCKDLTLIECHAVLPPTLDKESNSKIELRVPGTSVNAYRSAKNWKNFKNILPLE